MFKYRFSTNDSSLRQLHIIQTFKFKLNNVNNAFPATSNYSKRYVCHV